VLDRAKSKNDIAKNSFALEHDTHNRLNIDRTEKNVMGRTPTNTLSTFCSDIIADKEYYVF